MTDYAGIDYGMGLSNIDRETGIRFGVINQNMVLQAWADSSEPDYGDPHCPKCGNGAVDSGDVETDTDAWDCDGCGDYACEDCRYLFDGDMAYGDEPNGYTLDDGEYKATQGSDGDIFVLKSPYYTHAQFCSPCAPGAGYLANPCPTGPKCYCFGEEWFDKDVEPCPYPIYRVGDDSGVPIYTPDLDA